MSVAFRRESDEEHLEPKFERPIAPGPNLVTARGLSLIAAEVARLEAAVAAAPDDAARAPLARDLRYWRIRDATAVVVPPAQGDEAAFGATVRFLLDGRERQVTIVGGDEADGDGRIAFTAPLARALIGGGAGDLIDFAGRADAIEIVAVE